MFPFSIIEAKNTQDVLHALGANPTAKLIGGGTNLVDLMKMDVEKPTQLINISALGLKKIETLANGGVMIGALVKNSDLAYHETIASNFPVLSQALLSGASAQLRNMATVGGNLMQRTRCPYFFNSSFACNKRSPGSGCPAINGYNRSHAILGTSDKCIATHPSDMCVALVALDAIIHVTGSKGERAINANDFFVTPEVAPERETVLEHNELITSIELPSLPFASNSHYLKVRDRASYEFALTSAAVALKINNGTIQSARIALGGVGTKPWRAMNAEKMLTGSPNTLASYESAANEALKDAKGSQHNLFKIELAKRTIVRALQTTGGLS